MHLLDEGELALAQSTADVECNLLGVLEVLAFSYGFEQMPSQPEGEPALGPSHLFGWGGMILGSQTDARMPHGHALAEVQSLVDP
jgi:hypothetical protein